MKKIQNEQEISMTELKSGEIYYNEGNGKIYFRTNNIDGTDKVYTCGGNTSEPEEEEESTGVKVINNAVEAVSCEIYDDQDNLRNTVTVQGESEGTLDLSVYKIVRLTGGPGIDAEKIKYKINGVIKDERAPVSIGEPAGDITIISMSIEF